MRPDPGRAAKPSPVTPALRRLLAVVLLLFALLAVDSAYLGGITLLEWATGTTWQDARYQIVFLAHLVLGLAIVPPFLVFAYGHLRRAYRRPNRRAVRAGMALLATALMVILSGLVLTRFGFLEVDDPRVREPAYWLHVTSPLVLAWLFVLHRLAGHPVRWRVGARWAGVAAGISALLLGVHALEGARRPAFDAAAAEARFAPSLATTASGGHIPARVLMMQDYCERCHEDIARDWRHSVHHLSSFNNPAYRFSVEETRRVSLQRHGDMRVARFCAGCHDPVPFFSGEFDDPDYDTASDSARAGITCTACHAITSLDSRRGNTDYTISEPRHYPFTFSDNPFLQAVNRQLIRAKPEFHKQSFLKPLHRTPEFCATCHKVHIPEAVNDYRWLRGQDHYDSWLLSGVSGHGIASFYYPPRAITTCGHCHMPLEDSADPAADYFDDSGRRRTHGHLFAAANTAVPHMVGLREGNAERQAFLEGSLRLDLFGLREGGTLEGALTAPLRPAVPALEPGRSYLLEVVLRTLTLGHHFTQGTADSNEVWVDVTVSAGGRVIGRSGGLDAAGEVDPWSHFANAYVLDGEARRIDRRNAQDIVVALYNRQIPPGAGEALHYRLRLPADVTGPVTVEAHLRYRKFDTAYLRHILGEDFVRNDLPVTTIASDRIVFPVGGGAIEAGTPDIPDWQRWNDYGIGLLRQGALRQAEAAFRAVERLGRPDGPLNLARVYLDEGRLDEAVAALHRAAAFDPPAPPWSVAWFTAQVNRQNGYLEEAMADLRAIVETRFAEARARGFDFSRDVRVLNALGETLYQLARRERGEQRRPRREALLAEAADWLERALAVDPENAPAHYNLALIHAERGEDVLAAEHRALHRTYKTDENARQRVLARHRAAHPAADHAAEAIVVHDLQRAGAYGLNAVPGAPLAAGATPGTGDGS